VTRSAPQPEKAILPIGESIAVSLNAPLANVFPKLFAATPAVLKAQAPKLAMIANDLSTEARQLAALGTRNQDVAQFKRVIADETKAAAFAQAGAQAAARGDAKAFVAAAGPNGAGGLVKHGPQFGFHVCDIPSSSAPASPALPPGVRTVTVGAIRIAYRATGSGPPLLLINDAGSTLDTWDPSLLAGLGAGRRIIVFDPRGMGASTDVAGDRLTVEEMVDDAACSTRWASRECAGRAVEPAGTAAFTCGRGSTLDAPVPMSIPACP